MMMIINIIIDVVYKLKPVEESGSMHALVPWN